MKSFVVFNRKKDSDTFFPVPVRNREFLVRSSIHMEKNKTWSSVVRVRELEDQIFSSEKNEKSKRPLKEKRTSGKKLFKRTNELFFPLVLVLFLGIVAFAIGRHMEAKVPHNTPGGISKNPASNIAVSGQIINTTHLNPDSISLHEKSTLNGLVTTSTFQSNKNGALDKGYYREHWGKFMILSNSTYKHKFLGGIKDLSIMFTNNTDFHVNKVVAAITYLKHNHKPWKTKLVPLYNIAPHSEKEQQIDNVCRGKLVQISIKKIICSDLDLYYTTRKNTE